MRPWLFTACIALSSASPQSLPECRPGTFLQQDILQCVDCEAGHGFTSNYNRNDACTPCASCTGGRREISRCTVTQNTICGCGENEYEHSDGCSPTQGNYPDSHILSNEAQLKLLDAKLDNLATILLGLKNGQDLWGPTSWKQSEAAANPESGDRLLSVLKDQQSVTSVHTALLSFALVLLLMLTIRCLKDSLSSYSLLCQNKERSLVQATDSEREAVKDEEKGKGQRKTKKEPAEERARLEILNEDINLQRQPSFSPGEEAPPAAARTGVRRRGSKPRSFSSRSL